MLTRLSASTANEKTASFRLGLWKVAGETIKRHPVFGVGIGDFLRGYREVVTTRPDLYVGYLGFGAHNAYFALLAEIGVDRRARIPGPHAHLRDQGAVRGDPREASATRSSTRRSA